MTVISTSKLPFARQLALGAFVALTALPALAQQSRQSPTPRATTPPPSQTAMRSDTRSGGEGRALEDAPTMPGPQRFRADLQYCQGLAGDERRSCLNETYAARAEGLYR